MRFFNFLNQWWVVMAALMFALAINLGLLFYHYLPMRVSPPPGSLQERTVPRALEDTAPTTVMEDTSP